MYKNFSSLGLFTEGPARHKNVRQLNKLMADYGIDVLASCETQTDWQFVKKEEDSFCNLFGNGQPTRGSHASNINDHKIKRDQWGGTCVNASRRFASFVTLTGVDTTVWLLYHTNRGGYDGSRPVVVDLCWRQRQVNKGDCGLPAMQSEE
jgi:hypothetical protein